VHRHEYGIYKLDVDADPDEHVGSDSARLRSSWEIRYAQAPSTTFGSFIITMGAGSGEHPQENHYLQYNSGGR
jgi:hypothetical protein